MNVADVVAYLWSAIPVTAEGAMSDGGAAVAVTRESWLWGRD